MPPLPGHWQTRPSSSSPCERDKNEGSLGRRCDRYVTQRPLLRHGSVIDQRPLVTQPSCAAVLLVWPQRTTDDQPMLAASRCAIVFATVASSASTINRSTGSVPDGRIRTRPHPANSRSTAAVSRVSG